ncbi:hypothetical protein QBC38DRAFT_456253 [Podospora fimiseda]|uniref:Uncharacterized protein n=1 Tax=Podospora fimiseda TaxID=252190 RepID=A0AAN7GXM9_9PEZI|nr:hypothetical protein QBC38DRAFT_456253 [Podospora fimiseda]
MAYPPSYPPSYQDATRRDWLELVAPYCPISTYANLCQVSRRFHAQFAPRLWNDPLTAGRLLNRDDGKGQHLCFDTDLDLEWFYRFMRHIKGGLDENIRALVHSVDLRAVVYGTSEFSIFAADNCTSSSSPLVTALGAALSFTFPKLRCVLLDGHSDIDIGVLAGTTTGRESPLLLSIAQCQVQVPTAFFASPFLRNLIYLDVSDMPGSLKGPLVQGTLSPANLPVLRILKAQGREMDDLTASLLVKTFKDQIWSLDLSRNKVTDRLLGDLEYFAFPAAERLRGGDMEVEGRLEYLEGQGTSSFGRFFYVKETEWSKMFSHPGRYFVDSPEYAYHGSEAPSSNVRLDGRVRARKDSADDIKTAFSGGTGYLPPSREDVLDLDICQSHHGITHLYLNNNNISSTALIKMVIRSPGQLQRLECDTTVLDIDEKSWPSASSFSSSFANATVSGILGAAHIFRPVFSSNLQTLWIHHSLVTQLVTLDLDTLPTMTRWWLAEKFLLPRAELAYPQAFMPDMNPRLLSLTLTHLPRWSTGPVIDKLISFLKLAALQEHEIQKSKSRTRRGPTTVEGLRHLRLEFDPDPLEDEGNIEDDSDELDPEELIRLAAKEFSFFGGSWDSEKKKTKSTHEARHSAAPSGVALEPRQNQDGESVRLDSGDSALSFSPLYYDGTWNGSEFKVQMFTGEEKNNNTPPAVNEYLEILRQCPELHEELQPASPCHVAAGVPEGGYIFEAAWRAMLVRGVDIKKPTKRELRENMKDVIEIIKRFRMKTRSDGRVGVHYGGLLEVVRT